jgi:hypothetical protein
MDDVSVLPGSLKNRAVCSLWMAVARTECPSAWPGEKSVELSKSRLETVHADRLTLRTIRISSWIRFGSPRWPPLSC